MNTGTKFCSVCHKEKEQFYNQYVKKSFYIECECEKALREKREQADREYAIKTAYDLMTKSSHIPPICLKADFDTMTVDKHNERAVKACKYVLRSLLADKCDVNKMSLVLQGNRGSGKTYIATALINGYNKALPLAEQRIKDLIKERNYGNRAGETVIIKSGCKFITEGDLFALYYENFNYCKTEGPLDEFKRAPKLLVIDDVGTCSGDAQRVQSLYNNIIDYRYSHLLPTIITTNLPRIDLGRYIGDRAFDRLQSEGYFVDLTSPSSRR